MKTNQVCELDWMDSVNATVYSPPADCEQGSVPSYYVGNSLFSCWQALKNWQIDVNSPSDVIAALQFVNKTGITLSIKNTGVSPW